MADEYVPRTPMDLAVDQLVYAIVLEREIAEPGYLDRLQQVGAGKARISTDVDVAFRDLMLTIRGKARQAGIIP